MAHAIKSISASQLHGRYNLRQQFHDGVNILHGKNGSGKTTLLHLLANILNANYERFAYLHFKSIEVKLYDGTIITVKRARKYIHVRVNDDSIAKFIPDDVIHKDDEIRSRRDEYRQRELAEFNKSEEKYDPILPVAYFPAFRTMIEAWAAQNSMRRYRVRSESTNRKIMMTQFARKLFGYFVPVINYSSILDIEVELSDNIEKAIFQVASKDRELLTQSFLNILPALNREDLENPVEDFKPSSLLREIKKLLDDLQSSPFEYKTPTTKNIYTQLRKTVREFPVTKTSEGVAIRILGLYKKLLEDRISTQAKAFEEIENYLDSVNDFLEDKEISISKTFRSRSDTSIVVSFSDGSESSLRTLSSGERQIVTLLYAATKMSKQEVVLIDEPEISLHVDWQRGLLKKMSSQLSDRQIITCTHSPVIGADYEKAKQELEMIL